MKKTLIDNINAFESLADETVQSFNSIFVHCPIVGENLSDIVTIGGPCSPETVRFITVGEKVLRHDFKPHVDESDFPESAGNHGILTGEWKARKEAGLPFWKDKNGNYVEERHNFKPRFNTGDNFVMTRQEMELEPVHYFILQYLRGCEHDYHTQTEIGEKLNISVRSIRDNLHKMQELGIIKQEVSKQKTKITIDEKWQ